MPQWWPVFEADGERWLSAHLYFGANIYGSVPDLIARDVVAPMVARCRAERRLEGYFFVRYIDHGPHLRLRLRVRQRAAAEVAELLLAHVRRLAPTAELDAYDPGVADLPEVPGSVTMRSRDGRGEGDSSITAMRWFPYRREVDRYGGPDAIAVAESVFEVSSDAALTLLRGVDTRPRSVRLGRGLLAMLATLHLCYDGAAAAATAALHFGTGYLHTLSGGAGDASVPWERSFAKGFGAQATTLRDHVETAWRCMDAGESLPMLETFSAVLRRARAHLDSLCGAGAVVVNGVRTERWASCAPRLVPSFMHMMNNRLGITIPEEAYLAHLIHWALNGVRAPSLV